MVHSLDHLTSAATVVDGVRASDLEPGDCVLVRTRNSLYTLRVNADGSFDVDGGWFAREGGARRRVVGCTWGGTVLLTCMIAAPGMFLEFDNHVRTTRIREVRHFRLASAPTIH